MKHWLGVLLLLTTMACSSQPPPVHARALTPRDIEREIEVEARQHAYIRNTIIAADILRRYHCDEWIAEKAARHAMDAGIPAEVVAADIVVESGCRTRAVSKDGAVGLMQVIPKLWAGTYNAHDLFDPDENLRVGTAIMAGNIRMYGLQEGVARYNGFGDDAEDYAVRVLRIAGRRPR